MNQNINDPIRNTSSEEGRNDDPALRDESGQQPGVSTMSDSNTDFANQETTQSVSDDPDTSDFDDDADDAFDDLDEEDDLDDEDEEDI